MAKQKRDRNNLIALTGAAALVAIAVNFAISAINNKHRKKKGYFTWLARLFKQIWELLVIIWELKVFSLLNCRCSRFKSSSGPICF